MPSPFDNWHFGPNDHVLLQVSFGFMEVYIGIYATMFFLTNLRRGRGGSRANITTR